MASNWRPTKQSTARGWGVQVDGVEHTLLQLQRVGDILGGENVIKALLTFACRVRDRAKEICPFGTGTTEYVFKGTSGTLAGARIRITKERKHLRELIFAARGKVSNIFEPSVIVGVDRKKAPHAHLVEFGHAGPRPAKEHPFLRPAADQLRGEMAAVMTLVLQQALWEAGIGESSPGFSADDTGWIG